MKEVALQQFARADFQTTISRLSNQLQTIRLPDAKQVPFVYAADLEFLLHNLPQDTELWRSLAMDKGVCEYVFSSISEFRSIDPKLADKFLKTWFENYINLTQEQQKLVKHSTLKLSKQGFANLVLGQFIRYQDKIPDVFVIEFLDDYFLDLVDESSSGLMELLACHEDNWSYEYFIGKVLEPLLLSNPELFDYYRKKYRAYPVIQEVCKSALKKYSTVPAVVEFFNINIHQQMFVELLNLLEQELLKPNPNPNRYVEALFKNIVFLKDLNLKLKLLEILAKHSVLRVADLNQMSVFLFEMKNLGSETSQQVLDILAELLYSTEIHNLGRIVQILLNTFANEFEYIIKIIQKSTVNFQSLSSRALAEVLKIADLKGVFNWLKLVGFANIQSLDIFSFTSLDLAVLAYEKISTTAEASEVARIQNHILEKIDQLVPEQIEILIHKEFLINNQKHTQILLQIVDKIEPSFRQQYLKNLCRSDSGYLVDVMVDSFWSEDRFPSLIEFLSVFCSSKDTNTSTLERFANIGYFEYFQQIKPLPKNLFENFKSILELAITSQESTNLSVPEQDLYLQEYTQNPQLDTTIPLEDEAGDVSENEKKLTIAKTDATDILDYVFPSGSQVEMHRPAFETKLKSMTAQEKQFFNLAVLKYGFWSEPVQSILAGKTSKIKIQKTGGEMSLYTKPYGIIANEVSQESFDAWQGFSKIVPTAPIYYQRNQRRVGNKKLLVYTRYCGLTGFALLKSLSQLNTEPAKQMRKEIFTQILDIKKKVLQSNISHGHLHSSNIVVEFWPKEVLAQASLEVVNNSKNAHYSTFDFTKAMENSSELGVLARLIDCDLAEVLETA